MGWRRGGRGGWFGPWPGAGPFSYLPPWQRPGWLYGRGMFMGMANPYLGYGGAPSPISYTPPLPMSYPTQRPLYYPQQLTTPQSQNIFPYYSMQQGQPSGYYPQSRRGIPVHMNCSYFNNGICTIRGTPVPANGAACPNFTPKI